MGVWIELDAIETIILLAGNSSKKERFALMLECQPTRVLSNCLLALKVVDQISIVWNRTYYSSLDLFIES